MQEDSRQLAVFDTFMSYSGPDLDEHEMDVKLFADALVGNAQIARSIGSIVLGPEIEVDVKIRAVKENGIQAEILLYVSEAANTIHLLYNNDIMLAIRELKEMLGILPDSLSIYLFIKYLKGRKIKNAEIKGENTTVTLPDDTQKTISTKLYYVLINVGIVNGIKKLIAPLNRKGIDKFKLLDAQVDTPPLETTVIDKKEDLPAFKAYIKNQIEYTHEHVIECTLDRPSYQGKAFGWKLVRPGYPDITVTVKDKEFLYDVEKKNIKVDAESIFRVWYIEMRKENKNGDIVLKYEATRIIPLS